MLSGGFAENRIASLDEGFPRDKEYLKDEYDYDSDSDLEDEHEDELENANVADEEVGSRSGATGASSSQPQIQAREGKQPERRSFLQNEEDVSVPPLEPAPVAALAAAGEKYGRVIALPTGAHRTWGALLSYLYTGGIQFAPLKTNPDQSRAKQKFFSPQCSPKSMYRLADRYGLEALKKKAQDEIKAQLSPDNIMQELRSSLTSFYDEIRDMEVKFACETAQLPRVIEGPELSKWITDLAAGELTHTANNLHALVRQIGMSKTQNRTLPLCTGCFRSYPDCDFSCTSCGGYMHLV
ncbi:hypothetical protein BC835DRAFT_1387086 [Cytidiella melzeri]|nr:hypothetical protein BC835DRAFT_1387086 [Cytidiella melzeri]